MDKRQLPSGEWTTDPDKYASELCALGDAVAKTLGPEWMHAGNGKGSLSFQRGSGSGFEGGSTGRRIVLHYDTCLRLSKMTPPVPVVDVQGPCEEETWDEKVHKLVGLGAFKRELVRDRAPTKTSPGLVRLRVPVNDPVRVTDGWVITDVEGFLTHAHVLMVGITFETVPF